MVRAVVGGRRAARGRAACRDEAHALRGDGDVFEWYVDGARAETARATDARAGAPVATNRQIAQLVGFARVRRPRMQLMHASSPSHLALITLATLIITRL